MLASCYSLLIYVKKAFRHFFFFLVGLKFHHFSLRSPNGLDLSGRKSISDFKYTAVVNEDDTDSGQ